MGVCVYSIEVPQTCRSGGTIHAPIILVSDQVIVACPFLLLGALRKPTSRQRRRQNAARDVRILRQLELDRRATHKHVPLDEAVRFPGYSVHRHALQIRRHERPLTPEKRHATTHLHKYRLRGKVLRADRRVGVEQRVEERYAREEG